MKKIFFLLFSMNLGGVEKSFIELLSTINSSKFEVHLGLMRKCGQLMNSLPHWVIVHQIGYYDKFYGELCETPLCAIKYFRQLHIIKAVELSYLYCICKIRKTRMPLYKHYLRNQQRMEGEFDLAVAYSSPSDMTDYYVANMVDAKSRCAWIHFDVSKIVANRDMISRLYPGFNRVFCVSKTAKDIFDSSFPQLAAKTEVFLNVVSRDRIMSLSNEYNAYHEDSSEKRLLTVGRISKEKGVLMALDALAIVLSKGINVKWYFVGTGDMLSMCISKAESLGIAANVEFCGEKINPYPYMKNCDIYVQPSYYEGYCIALAESRVFSHPIVATNFTGAVEQLSSRSNAVVVDVTADAIAEGIIKACRMQDLTYVDEIEQSDINQLLNLCYDE
jgi:glycosyltransferase involved in cell wall biosynthesis